MLSECPPPSPAIMVVSAAQVYGAAVEARVQALRPRHPGCDHHGAELRTAETGRGSSGRSLTEEASFLVMKIVMPGGRFMPGGGGREKREGFKGRMTRALAGKQQRTDERPDGGR